ncbi:acetyl-CoA carboxylase [Paracoccus sp. 22332]|jgi:Biotin carboxyl carrier protein|uniref:acetyl-CoA carboxylase n=1 Tax=Paracoccus sp. 22332 TaxID=3453913 RepID=UPI003F8582F1
MKQILAPLPGVFYRRPSPEEPRFAEEGQPLAAGATVGLIEAMKSFFPVETEEPLTITRFLVGDGDTVDADQPVAEAE